MIVRNNEENFIMIDQHDHAILSEQLIKNMDENLFPEGQSMTSVLYAIKMHDVGWINFDKAPFWNVEKQEPYSFIDYPNPIKTVLYTHGINTVANEDLYAGLLCSMHYSFFLADDNLEASRDFAAAEKHRQKVIIDQLEIDEKLLNFHFELLKFADDLSLYLCLHEPGTSHDHVHYFFEKGVRLPERFHKKLGERIKPEWLNEEAISCNAPLFKAPFEITIPLKKISKSDITKYGLTKCFDEAQTYSFHLKMHY